MSGIPVNFDDVEAWSGGVILNPGVHIVEVRQAETGKTNNQKHDQITVGLEAISGPEPGASITDWITVTEGSMGRVLQILKALKVELPAGDFNLTGDMVLGKRAKIIVGKKPKHDDPSKMVSFVQAYAQAPDDAVADAQQAFPGSEEIPEDGNDIPF